MQLRLAPDPGSWQDVWEGKKKEAHRREAPAHAAQREHDRHAVLRDANSGPDVAPARTLGPGGPENFVILSHGWWFWASAMEASRRVVVSTAPADTFPECASAAGEPLDGWRQPCLKPLCALTLSEVLQPCLLLRAVCVRVCPPVRMHLASSAVEKQCREAKHGA